MEDFAKKSIISASIGILIIKNVSVFNGTSCNTLDDSILATTAAGLMLSVNDKQVLWKW